jgi:hypothetical protein
MAAQMLGHSTMEIVHVCPARQTGHLELYLVQSLPRAGNERSYYACAVWFAMAQLRANNVAMFVRYDDELSHH